MKLKLGKFRTIYKRLHNSELNPVMHSDLEKNRIYLFALQTFHKSKYNILRSRLPLQLTKIILFGKKIWRKTGFIWKKQELFWTQKKHLEKKQDLFKKNRFYLSAPHRKTGFIKKTVFLHFFIFSNQRKEKNRILTNPP